MKTENAVIFALAACAAALAGCRSYEPAAAPDWEEGARLRTPRVTFASPKDAARLALAGNPELNAMRLRCAGAANVAKETGWWEDPELDFDLLRIVEPSTHPFLGGAGMKFTIPLSGSNRTAAKAAEAYHLAQAEKIRAAEKTIAAEAEKAALAIHYNREKAKTVEAHEKDAGVKRATRSAERLHAAGECTLADLNSVKRAEHARRHLRMKLDEERQELENSLRSLAGLHPGTRIETAFSVAPPANGRVAAPDILSLTAHPAVKAALAELERSEAELETEIRRQYPDLKIGPLAGSEEGKGRIGVVAGVTLPLWNRNRKAIAEAEAARGEARLDALNTWRNLALEAGAAHAKIANLLKHRPAPPGETKCIERLLDAGEMTPVEYLSTREEILTLALEEISWEAAVAQARADAARFTVETISNERTSK